MDDFVEQQSKCSLKERDNLDAIGECMNELTYVVEALRYVGNDTLATKLKHIAYDVNIHIKNVKDAQRQHSANFMKMSRDADKEFMQTILNHA